MNLKILNRVFSNTQNSYKFYWLLAILDITSNYDKRTISFNEIVLIIISKLWYPVNYYKLNFGYQDRCAFYIKQIKSEFELVDNLSEKELYDFLIENHDHKLLTKITTELTKYVPYRFIRPWYSLETRGLKDSKVNSKILQLQDSSAPYKIENEKNYIIINLDWQIWLNDNSELLYGFTYLELIKHLEKNNPLIPNISSKLKKPESRNLFKAIKLWKLFISINPYQVDVFESKRLINIKNISIDHFLPWSVLSHDLLWNLHPTEKNINSSKNNCLPSLKYLDPFLSLQFDFFQFILNSKRKELEEYNLIFRTSTEDLKNISHIQFKKELENQFKPMFENALNMGFASNWEWDN